VWDEPCAAGDGLLAAVGRAVCAFDLDLASAHPRLRGRSRAASSGQGSDTRAGQQVYSVDRRLGSADRIFVAEASRRTLRGTRERALDLLEADTAFRVTPDP
jgi:hypothetical protein